VKTAVILPIILCIFAASSRAAQARSAPPEANPQQKAAGSDQSRMAIDRLERLSQMSKEERQAALANLPPEVQERLEQRLDKLDSLAPEERQALLDRFRRFSELPPDRQEQVRTVVRQLQALPMDRRIAVKQELSHLRQMPHADRQARLNSSEVKAKFSPEERGILGNTLSLP